jgi:CheY-like chemotaxis protein
MAYRILIVDDQREVSRLLRSALETIEQGLTVSEAPSGEEALLEASRGQIDLVVADYRLPGMTGVELMKKIRARHPNAKVIMITGVTEPRMRREISEAGADAYFTKPVPMADFLDAVERTLGLTRTILHEATSVSEPEERNSLADLLVDLRKTLNAKSVILLNSIGHVQAEAGELPDPNNAVSLIASIMGMYNAAQKAASLLGGIEQQAYIFQGAGHDVACLPAGPAHVLLVVGKQLTGIANLPKTLETIQASCAAILEVLAKIGAVDVPLEQAEEPAPAGIPAFLESVTIPSDFDELLRKASTQGSDANAFWDAAIEKGTAYTEPDKLTYEQAAQLGLAPKTGEEK